MILQIRQIYQDNGVNMGMRKVELVDWLFGLGIRNGYCVTPPAPNECSIFTHNPNIDPDPDIVADVDVDK